MSRELAKLGTAAEALCDYLDQDEGLPDRDKVRDLVFAVNEHYLNWAFDVDNAQLTVVE